MQPAGPKMRGIAVPVEADSVEGPIVTYGDGPASINFFTQDERWGRVTFEKLDSLRVSRGEYEPYPSDWKEGDPYHWVSVVAPSPWLRERYEYEKRHYGQAYAFGADVDEMLRDFSHYVFSFHDQFVEVLCAGIWFESADECIGAREPDPNHPLLNLPASNSATFEAHGITCQIRRNSRPLDEIVKDAVLCSQKLLQYSSIFTVLQISPAVFASYFRRLSLLHKGVHFSITAGGAKQEYFAANGIADMFQHIAAPYQLMHEPIQFVGKKDELILECVMAYHSWSEDHPWLFINNGRAVQGGTHERGIFNGIKRLKKKLDLPEQVDNGLILVASIHYPNVIWEGCIKSIVSNPELKTMVSSLMVSETVKWLKEHSDVYEQIRQLQSFQFPEVWYR